MERFDLSNHPIDQLIRECVQTRRIPERNVIGRVLDRVATAAFNSGMVQVERFEQDTMYGDRRLLAWDDSLFVHLVRRVVLDQQWQLGTTDAQYIEDLHRAARARGIRLAVYPRRGGSLAAVVAATRLVVPAERRGPRSLSEVIVIHFADRGIIVTGYQVEGLETVSIPEDALWLL